MINQLSKTRNSVNNEPYWAIFGFTIWGNCELHTSPSKAQANFLNTCP